MIVKLTDTTSAAVAARLAELREAGLAPALGRVFTLIVVVPKASEVEVALAVTTQASKEHPCRVIVVSGTCVDGECEAQAGALDAEIRVGAEAGASDVVILHGRGEVGSPQTLVTPLLLPDSPIVVWWPTDPPLSPSRDPLGRIAHRRITDSRETANPVERLRELAGQYVPGDSDLSWSGVTLWRAMLVLAASEPPLSPITGVDLYGNGQHPAMRMIGAWLALKLDVAVRMHQVAGAATICRVELHRQGGDVVLDRGDGSPTAVLSRPGVPDMRVVLPRRATADCLMEELRRLDVDATYGQVITTGLDKVAEVVL